MPALVIATIGAPREDAALRAQGFEPLTVDWDPPARGDLGVVSLLTRAYADDEMEDANREALRRLDAARPHLVGAGLAGELVPGLDDRTILHPGPPVEWEHVGPPLRRALVAAVLLEGWAPDADEATAILERGAIALSPAHAFGVAIPMCAVLSPSMAAWAVTDEESGIDAWAPFIDPHTDALWTGNHSVAAIRRQRLMADRVAPGIAAALGQTGPIDLAALSDEAEAMGDDGVVEHRAATMLLMWALLDGLATRALDAVPPITALVSGNDRFALPLMAAGAHAALQSTLGVPRSSLVAAITSNGTDIGVMLSGLPGAWFTAPAPIPDQAEFVEGASPVDAAPWVGDQGLLELVGVDARLCLDLDEAPSVATAIVSRTRSGWIGEGAARTPMAPIRDALMTLLPMPGTSG